jgi:hypothetical protein
LVITTLDHAQEREALDLRILGKEVELRAGTSRIRFKVHNESGGDVLVPILGRGKRGLGDISQNRVVSQIPDPDVSAVGLVRFGRLRRAGTTDGGTTSHNRALEWEATTKELGVGQSRDGARGMFTRKFALRNRLSELASYFIPAVVLARESDARNGGNEGSQDRD